MAKDFSFTSSGEDSGIGGETIDFGAIAIDPTDIGSSGSDSGGDNGSGTGSVDDKPRRGRKPRDPNAPKPERKPRGSNRPDAATYKAGIETLSNTLKLVHMGIAGMTNSPELQLNDLEAESLSKATSEIMIQFGVAPDPKIQAVVGLIITGSMVYGPKVVQIRQRLKQEKKESKPKGNLGLYAVNETA